MGDAESLVLALVAVVAIMAAPYLLLLWVLWAVSLAWTPRSRHNWRELLRALMLAAAPALLAGAGSAMAVAGGAAPVVPPLDSLIVPAPLVAGLSAAGATFVFALAVRLRHPPPAPDTPDHLVPSDHLFLPWVSGALLTLVIPAIAADLADKTWIDSGAVFVGLLLLLPVLAVQRGAYAWLDRVTDASDPECLVTVALNPPVVIAGGSVGVLAPLLW